MKQVEAIPRLFGRIIVLRLGACDENRTRPICFDRAVFPAREPRRQNWISKWCCFRLGWRTGVEPVLSAPQADVQSRYTNATIIGWSTGLVSLLKAVSSHLEEREGFEPSETFASAR